MLSPRGSLASRKRARIAAPSDDNASYRRSPASERSHAAMNAHGGGMVAPFPSVPQLTDWRAVLCQFLGIPSQTADPDLLEELRAATEENQEAAVQGGVTGEPTYQIIYQVKCHEQSRAELYHQAPWPVDRGYGTPHLRGGQLVGNLELYLERNKPTTFLVYKHYACCKLNVHTTLQPSEVPSDGDISSLFVGEHVSVTSDIFRDALCALRHAGGGGIIYPDFENDDELSAPYIWWYHQRHRLCDVVRRLTPKLAAQIALFGDYVSESLGQEYNAVDRLLGEGKMIKKLLPYLYVPGEIQLTRLDSDDPESCQAFQALTYLSPLGYITARYWDFDGLFQQKTTQLAVAYNERKDQEVDIQDLDVYPMKYAGQDTIDALRRRGAMFWECRWPKYVCCDVDSAFRFQTSSDARYMVDIRIFKEMHPPSDEHVPNTDDLGPEITAQGKPPPQNDDFLLCLPPTVSGYHMHKKAWVKLPVSRMTEVKWNQDAFKKLVVDDQKKELIKALVTNRIAAGESTDLMSGKGNGLFILLHGGPGTGKTLTAESVAEIAEKPLYRVTCGDIGTKAEDVERYLETVLLLGKAWECVVLLDEADVFLMQRSVSDFERNALVSVFLRVLEYYDGILILTSNRVGTFDAAFKSRIQLSLHYPALQEADRLKIWKNFIEHIQGLTSSRTAALGIKVDEIKRQLPELAKISLNGREIRNAVSTARQLAMFKNEPMGYKHLDLVIGEMKKFDDYATGLKGGLTDDEIARGFQER